VDPTFTDLYRSQRREGLVVRIASMRGDDLGAGDPIARFEQRQDLVSLWQGLDPLDQHVARPQQRPVRCAAGQGITTIFLPGEEICASHACAASSSG